MTEKTSPLPPWALPLGVAVVLVCVIGSNFIGAFKAGSVLFVSAIAFFIGCLLATNPWTRARLGRLFSGLRGPARPPGD